MTRAPIIVLAALLASAAPARGSVRITAPPDGSSLPTSAANVVLELDDASEAETLTVALNGVDITGRLRGTGTTRSIVLAGARGHGNVLRVGDNHLVASVSGSSTAIRFVWHPGRARVHVVVVGNRIDFGAYVSPVTWQAEVDRIFTTLVQPNLRVGRPNLVLLTEDFGLPTALLGTRGAAARAARDAAPLAGLGSLFTTYGPQAQYYLDNFPLPGTGIQPFARALELALTDTLWRNFVPRLSAKAAEYGVYLAACTNVAPAHLSTDSAAAAFFGDVDNPGRTDVFLPDGTDVYNTAFLWDPHGQLLGTTRKVFLTPPEIDLLNLSNGALEDVQTFDTPIGRLGVAISLDAFIPTYVQRLDDLGATFVLQPDANPQLWAAPAGAHPWQPQQWTDSMLGMLQAAYPNLTYNATSMMTGAFFPGPPGPEGFPTGIVFDGQSTITRRGPRSPRRSFVAMGPIPYTGEFIRVSPWAFPDPATLRSAADLAALQSRCGSTVGGSGPPRALSLEDRRALLSDCARTLLPGGSNEGQYRESVVTADLLLPVAR